MTPSADATRPPLAVAADRRFYIPFASAFLTVDREIDFTVYLRKPSGGLHTFLPEGNALSAEDRERLRTSKSIERLHARADQREAVLRHGEEYLGRLLADDQISVYARSYAIHNWLSLMAQALLDDPGGLAVFRLKRGVGQLVDFLRREPVSFRFLLGMAHRRYDVASHSVNVGLYALALALRYYPTRFGHDWAEMGTAFFVHDIGKAKVRPEILKKPGPLNHPEWWEMKRHPAYGMRILERGGVVTTEVEAVVLQHHERMDGLGYPRALTGARIHPYARLCSIADAYDALTTHRSFRAALNPFEALKIMKDEMHTQFDPGMFKTFVVMLKQQSEKA